MLPLRDPHDADYVSAIIHKELLESAEKYRSYLLGKVLTIIDASISDPEQRKALKDVIQHAFYEGDRLDDTIKIRYTMASLSRALRHNLTESSDEELEAYEQYYSAKDYEHFGNVLEKKLDNAALG